MPSSPVTSMTSTTTDVVAPGAPAFAGDLVQTSNTTGKVTVIWPTLDADGSSLTGLTHGFVAVAPGANAFAGMSAADVKAMPGVNLQATTLSNADAGTSKDFDVPVLVAGQTQSECCFCDDEP